MTGRLFQNVHVVNALPNESTATDLFNGGVATDVVNLGKYEKATWILQKGAGNTGTAVLKVESCDNTTPSTATAVAFNYWECTSGDTWGDMQTATSAGFTTTAGANTMVAVEINSAELSGTDQYARLTATEVADDPVTGYISCILSQGKVVQEVSPTAIV